jgi:F-type H+-transporting ATPase subunit gamma
MADTKTIKTKLKSVGSIGKITKAMEMVARSKMKKAIDRALGVRPYAFFALEFLVNFSYHTAAVSPLFKKTDGKKILLVVIASDKGLCGGYNANIFRELRRFVSNEGGVSLFDFATVGRQAAHHVSLLESFPTKTFRFSDSILLSEVEQMATYLRLQYESGAYRSVMILSTHFKNSMSQKPVVRQLLPLSGEVFKNQLSEAGDEENWVDVPAVRLERDWQGYKIEPSEDDILNTVIPQMMLVQVFQAVLDAAASEEASRMMAMKSATENADKLAFELRLSYNHARQEGITRELSEIAAGANALAL